MQGRKPPPSSPPWSGVGVDPSALEDEQHAPLCYLYLPLHVCEVYFFVFNSDRLGCTALLTFFVFG